MRSAPRAYQPLPRGGGAWDHAVMSDDAGTLTLAGTTQPETDLEVKLSHFLGRTARTRDPAHAPRPARTTTEEAPRWLGNG